MEDYSMEFILDTYLYYRFFKISVRQLVWQPSGTVNSIFDTNDTFSSDLLVAMGILFQ
jgi:hypothetical protein